MLVDWNSELYTKCDHNNRPLIDSINTHYMRFVDPHDSRTKKYIARRAQLELLLMMIKQSFSIAIEVSRILPVLQAQWIAEDSDVNAE